MSGHDHSHALPAAGRRGRLAVVFSITATIMVAEVIGALASGSLALLADAGHMFTDSAGLLIALTAATLELAPIVRHCRLTSRNATFPITAPLTIVPDGPIPALVQTVNA